MSGAASPELDLAFFSERAVAFGVDLALAVAGYFLSLKAAFPAYGTFSNPYAYAWTWLWVALFVAYQAFSNAGGRRSWGKALVGIHVCDAEGRPLSLARSSARAGSMLVSGLFYLGFLWPLFDERLRAWHDLLARTFVVQDEPRAARPLLVGGAWAVAGGLAAHSLWVFVLSGPFYRLQTIAAARSGLEEVASLERQYRDEHGRYTDNLFVLAAMTGAPNAFLEEQSALFEPQPGVALEPEGQGLRISAVAQDERHTPVSLTLQ